jgi:predicted O-methyltransferase YrrM
MKNSSTPFAGLPDAHVRAVLGDLHARAGRQERLLPLRFLDQIPSFLLGRGINWDRFGDRLRDQFICLDPSQGMFCYLTARALGARQVVEFGTSFGVSTIYLALAVRENGGGRVIGTELVPQKAARAREHLRQAGLESWVEIREGDARDTLRDLDQPVDLLLCDGCPPAMLPVLQLVAPHLRVGGIVIADNVGAFWGDHREYLAWVRDPVNGFQSAMLAMNEGTALSVKVR